MTWFREGLVSARDRIGGRFGNQAAVASITLKV
jgi:hypothetical protein